MQRHVEQTAGEGIPLVQARLAKDLVRLSPAKVQERQFYFLGLFGSISGVFQG